MPYRTEYVEPEVFFRHRGVTVYHTYKHDNFDEPRRSYWFTLDPACGEESCQCEGEKCLNVFDVRELPNWTEPPHPPFLTGTDDPPENRKAWREYHARGMEEKHVKRVIRQALERGSLAPGGGITQKRRPTMT